MTNERLIMAIGRLERALSRAETSGNDLINRAQSSDPEYQKLLQSHENLKKHATSSLAAIDSLLLRKDD